MTMLAEELLSRERSGVLGDGLLRLQTSTVGVEDGAARGDGRGGAGATTQ